MPSISQVISTNKDLARQQSNLTRPVAVLLGGTSGIGAGTARALVQSFDGNVHLILSSRSQQSAQNVIQSLPGPIRSTQDLIPQEKSTINTTVVDFIQSDATDVKSMKSLADGIKALGVEKVNYLVLSCGQLTLDGSDRTKDGVERKVRTVLIQNHTIDGDAVLTNWNCFAHLPLFKSLDVHIPPVFSQLAMNFYSRFALTYHLLPLLQKAASSSEPARVMSILAPSRGGKIDVDDFGLLKESEKSGKSLLWRGTWLRSAEKAGVTYNDLMTEGFSKLPGNQDLSFIHAFPGFVKTPMLKNFNLPIRVLFAPLVAFGSSEDDSGSYMLNALLRSDTKNGDHYVDPKGEKLGKDKAPAVWDEARLGSEGRSQIIEKLFNHLKEVGGLE